MLYIEDLIVIVRWLALIVATIDVCLVAYILMRRAARNRYYMQKDAARLEFSGIVRQFASDALDPAEAMPALLRARTHAQAAAVQELLLAAITPENREKVSDLLFQLGYIQMWADQAFGARRGKQLVRQIIHGEGAPEKPRKQCFRSIRRLRVFAVTRALPVAHFAHLAPRFAEVLLPEALADPSPYVTQPAVAGLGKTASPVAVPILLEQLRKAIEGQSGIPVSSAKAALVRKSTDNLKEFLSFLNSEEDRLRLLVVDTIREILNAKPSLLTAKDFPAELYRWFVRQAVHDRSADVRARSAAVIRHFHDTNSVAALRALLRDENEYVRLHAARACGDPFYGELIEDLVGCMTDGHWRVREAVARSLAAVGSAGANSLADFFLATNDRYASEQIADEFQRSRLILQIVAMLGSSGPEAQRASAVCAKMAGLGMTSLFSDLLLHESSLLVRTELMKILSARPGPRSTAAIQKIALKADDPLKNTAEIFLSSAATRAPAAERQG